MLHCFYCCQMTFPTGPLQTCCTALSCVSQKNTTIHMCVAGTACTSAFLPRLAGAAWSDVTHTHKQMYTHWVIYMCCWDCMHRMEWCHTHTQTDVHILGDTHVLLGLHVHHPSYPILLELHGVMSHRHTNRCTTQGDTHVLLGLHVHQPSYLVLLESHGVVWHAESSFGVFLHLT